MNKFWDIRSNYYRTVLCVAAAQWAKWSYRGNNSESSEAQYNFIWRFENSFRSVKLLRWIVGRWPYYSKDDEDKNFTVMITNFVKN